MKNYTNIPTDSTVEDIVGIKDGQEVKINIDNFKQNVFVNNSNKTASTFIVERSYDVESGDLDYDTEDRHILTYNHSTGIGLVHLDIHIPSEDPNNFYAADSVELPQGIEYWSGIIGTLPEGAPTPKKLIEYVENTTNARVYIEAGQREINGQGLIKGLRYIYNLIGFFDFDNPELETNARWLILKPFVNDVNITRLKATYRGSSGLNHIYEYENIGLDPILYDINFKSIEDGSYLQVYIDILYSFDDPVNIDFIVMKFRRQHGFPWTEQEIVLTKINPDDSQPVFRYQGTVYIKLYKEEDEYRHPTWDLAIYSRDLFPIFNPNPLPNPNVGDMGYIACNWHATFIR